MTWRRYKWLIVTVAAIAVAVIYTLVDPREQFMPKCVFKLLTGWDCPGCGTQRAIHALLHGRVAEAWHYNAALFVAVPLIVALSFADSRRDRYPRLFRRLYSPSTSMAVLVVTLAWWLGRNLF